MILKILFGLAAFMAIHSLTMMHMCHVVMKCENSDEMPLECAEMLSGNYSAWCVATVIAFAIVLISFLLIIIGRPSKMLTIKR